MFKNSQGLWLTRALFVDIATHGREEQLRSVEPEFAKFTLSTTDVSKFGKTYPSLHRLYVEMEDTTEYLFATKYLGGWTHWKALTECTFFENHLSAMREELSIKLKAKALQALQEVAGNPDDRRYVEANKFLLKEALDLPSRPVGRPVTKGKKDAPTEVIREEKRIKEDLKRLGLN